MRLACVKCISVELHVAINHENIEESSYCRMKRNPQSFFFLFISIHTCSSTCMKLWACLFIFTVLKQIRTMQIIQRIWISFCQINKAIFLSSSSCSHLFTLRRWRKIFSSWINNERVKENFLEKCFIRGRKATNMINKKITFLLYVLKDIEYFSSLPNLSNIYHFLCLFDLAINLYMHTKADLHECEAYKSVSTHKSLVSISSNPQHNISLESQQYVFHQFPFTFFFIIY